MNAKRLIASLVVSIFVLSSVAVAHASTAPATLTATKLQSSYPQYNLVVIVGRHFAANSVASFTAVNGTQFKFNAQPKTNSSGSFSTSFYIPKVFTGLITLNAKTATMSASLAIRSAAPTSAIASVAVPTKLHAYTGGADIAVLWKPEPNAASLAKYNIYRDGKLVASTAKTADSQYLEYNGARYYDKNVVAGQTYKYQIVAVGKDGKQSAASAPISVTQPKATTPVPKIVIDASAAPDLESLLTKLAVPTLETWYPKVSDALAYPDYTPASTITVKIGGQAGDVASTDTANAVINVDADYLRNNPQDEGMFVHEGTHVVQAYLEAQPPTFMVEGLADWTRAFMFHDRDDQAPTADQTYNDGYSPSADFMQWLVTTFKMGDVIRQANIAGHNGTYSDAMFTDKADGKTMAQLWAQFMANPKYLIY